jgi:hypothetical protein
LGAGNTCNNKYKVINTHAQEGSGTVPFGSVVLINGIRSPNNIPMLMHVLIFFLELAQV